MVKVSDIKHVFKAPYDAGLMSSMTGIPTPLVLDNCIRVWFYTRDSHGDGHIYHIDLDKQNPYLVINTPSEPDLSPGAPGLFDDSGVFPSQALFISDKIYLYYVGIQRSEKVPYHYYLGLALSTSSTKEKFLKYRSTPILERDSNSPFLRSAATIFKVGDVLRMIYVRSDKWFEASGKLYPRYCLALAESTDGLVWKDLNLELINPEPVSEFGLGRPWVVYHNDEYHLFFSVRGINNPYKVAYAKSSDGFKFERCDHQLLIEPSVGSWRDEMHCYSAVFYSDGRWYMLLNGNGMGHSGFGIGEVFFD